MPIKKESIEKLEQREKEILEIMVDMDKIGIHSCTMVIRQARRDGIASERETTRILKTLHALNRIATHGNEFTIMIPLTEEEMK